jgi:hypothetical protein
MNTAKMLKDLLERVESGEVVITNFDVSNDEEDGTLTGEQYISITTWPAYGKRLEKPDLTAADLFGNSVNRFGGVGRWLAIAEISTEVDQLISLYEAAGCTTDEFIATANKIVNKATPILSEEPSGSKHFKRLNGTLSKLARKRSLVARARSRLEAEQTEEPN